MKKSFNSEELEKLVDMYENTYMTIPEIADDLGTTVYSINREIKRLKDTGQLSVLNHRFVRRDNRLMAVAELSSIGCSKAVITRILNSSITITDNDVKECIKRGLINGKPHRRSGMTVDATFVISLRDKGLAKEEIRKETSLSDNVLDTLIKYIDMYHK